MKCTLGKEERLKSRKLIERVFREGKSFALFPFRVFYLSGGLPPHIFLQAGFGAGNRNFKKAVDRNRIKRLTREAYRLQKHPLEAHLKEKVQPLAVFFIYTGKELPDYQTVSGKIGLALQKLLKETDHVR
ncbi:MAG TPA: ribonuclease P protein component [Puia sp.]|nr:ribonuclease P protein component [Puia sp.]